MFSLFLQVFFKITVYIHYFNRFFSKSEVVFNIFTGSFQYYRVFFCFFRWFSKLQGIFFHFSGFFQYYMLFSNFLEVIVHTKCYYLYFCRLVSKLQIFFLSFYKLFSVFSQMIFNIFTGYFRKTYRFFSMFLHDYFKCFYRLVVKLQIFFVVFKGYFQYFYRLFSELQVFPVFPRLVWNITGTFLCFYWFRFHYYRSFSIILQVNFRSKNYFHFLCRFFSRLQFFFCTFTGYFQLFYRIIAIFLQVNFKKFTDFLQYF